MPQLLSVVIDTVNPTELAQFWCAALSARVRHDFNGAFVVIDSTPELCFQRVQEPTPGKNRLHLHVGADGDPGDFVDRLVGLGAIRLSSIEMRGASWTVLSDPEGNEFCVPESFDAEATAADLPPLDTRP